MEELWQSNYNIYIFILQLIMSLVTMNICVYYNAHY